MPYIGGMNTIKEDAPAQGARTSIDPPNLETIENWSLRDLNACIAFLTAIRDDTALRKQLAVWFHGKVVNHLNKPLEGPNGKK